MTQAPLPVTHRGQTRDGRKQYRHASGVRIVYRHNDYLWEIIGGAKDGDCYEPLWVARYEVERAS